MSDSNIIQRLRDLGEYHELASDAAREIEVLRFRVRELVAAAAAPTPPVDAVPAEPVVWADMLNLIVDYGNCCIRCGDPERDEIRRQETNAWRESAFLKLIEAIKPLCAAPVASRAGSEAVAPLIEALLAVQMNAVASPDVAGEHSITTATLEKVERALGNYSLTVPAKDRKVVSDASSRLYTLMGEHDFTLPHEAFCALVSMLSITPAPAAPTKVAEPVKWGYAKTVGNAIAQLQTMDPALPFYAALHLQDGRCIARGVTFSRERVVNERWIDNANKEVPYSIVVWSQPVESLHAPIAPAVAVAEPLTKERLYRLIEQSGVPYKQPVQQKNRFTDEDETVYVDTHIFSEFKFARLVEAAHGIAPKGSPAGSEGKNHG